ncbi:beta-ketoacyl-ACP synthase III [Paucilactobacillus wasatchensis]|uniref:Beta-ketoacyl-[acyl-carrier-protein] synthase III n=1 Tax=Paucilactobacillus wasatchensis TaxID=1335616 RepID=A0A0D1A7T8_9LACO|nr:beta-ketoacyl-ACP synthase III [Paucilactobacillus wasatchensis]KIS03777.1 3-oxoacyl-[acyl-carrier-protein] synthase [Paucilactobacillus wasatchensis]
MTYFAKLTTTASYLPERVVTNEELAQVMPTSDEWIVAHTGIKTRHYAQNDENTSDLATEVGRKLLQKSNLSADQVDLLIVTTITPDALTPATASVVQGKLQAINAIAFDVSAACAGFVFGLSIADKMMRSGQYRHAMVISAEVNSKMMDFTDRTSTVFFGDGAGGALLSRTNSSDEEFLIAEKLATDGSQAQTIHSGRINPITEIASTNYPTADAFYQDGRAVFEFATTAVPKQIEQLLAEAKIKLADIRMVVCHQANLRIIETICAKLKMPFDKFPHTVEKYGNMSSAGIPVTLDRLVTSANRQPILLSGFGAGLNYGSMLIRM